MSTTLGGRVAIVGTGHRAAMFVRGIVARPSSVVVAICEPNRIRAASYNKLLTELGAQAVPVYKPQEFKDMLQKEQVETIVVTCPDHLHNEYIVPALEAGVRVLTEKPMTTDIDKCRQILETIQRTGQHLTVTFNYRYNPVHELVKRTIAEGKIGKVLSVHFEWLLDTVHGADYFRRWHRSKANSGGLMVHKSGHHFDLVNWWIDSEPETVAGFGKLAFYGDKAGKEHGWARDYERARGSDQARDDPFAINIEADPELKGLYADAEGEDGYHRDQNVFAPGIGIEDDMSVMVRYVNGVTMTYHLTAYSPWEGYRVMFNGSQGRLELNVVESQFRVPNTADGLVHGISALPNAGDATVVLHNLWQKPVNLPVIYDHAGHGGGDARMLSVLFGPLVGAEPETGDAAKQSANERDGAMALVVGLLANESFKTEKFLSVKDLNLPL
ncbi:putative oxidoreductase YteT [Mycena indigotica]|uniref:Putative oxidoreductase YteT n=1 Tax=Mycena indigotica TaxID=2126181 RepID=A0A8H6TEZ9_9AGAR|nr:putative oxidoreductase YteT [Mycena indigotica]KAF7315491.1 putative oxidoreductase YteT [Mycena indigotica]